MALAWHGTKSGECGSTVQQAKTLHKQGVQIVATSELVWLKSLVVFKLLGGLVEDELLRKDQFDDLLEPKQTRSQVMWPCQMTL